MNMSNTTFDTIGNSHRMGGGNTTRASVNSVTQKKTKRRDPVHIVKPLLFVSCLLPLLMLVFNAFWGDLGVNPIETITRNLGDWGLRFLLITLAITPLRGITGLSWLPRLRRMLGLFAFAYATLHLASYVVLDQFFYWPEIWADILKRPYITVGMVVLIMMIPLAITSTDGMIRRLGGKRWKNLHKLSYVAAFGAILHYYMLVKADIREPLLYLALFSMLMIYRYWKKRYAVKP